MHIKAGIDLKVCKFFWTGTNYKDDINFQAVTNEKVSMDYKSGTSIEAGTYLKADTTLSW